MEASGTQPTERRPLIHQVSAHLPHVWSILGKKLPNKEVVFFTQVILLYVIIITCIVNLSRGAPDSNLWTCLMSSSLGYLLPNPKLENTTKKKNEEASNFQS